MIWTTPVGFLKAAAANHATVAAGQDGTTVSFTLPNGRRIRGLIDRRHHVVRVQAWTDQSIVGDMLIETDYGGYQNFDGVLFPSQIVQKTDGFPSLELTVTSVTTNPDIRVVPPAEIRQAAVPATPTVEAQTIAAGVYWLTGGTHHSLAIEMRDHIVVVDTPNGEARALAVLAKAKELIPRKTIRYVVATHHHWDHLGGIRTAIDEGATIVTHEANRSFLERIASVPHTIHPDRLAVSKRPLEIQTVHADGTLSDGVRVVKLYTMTGFDHTVDMLIVYLPREKILAEADAYTPPDGPDTPLIAPKVPYAAALYDNVQRLHLDVRAIVRFHGTRIVNLAELKSQAGR